MAIRAVIFDLGRVLVDVVIHEEFRRRLAWPQGEAEGNEPRRRLFEKLYRGFSTGRLTAHEFHRQLTNGAGVDIEIQELRHLWCSVLRPLAGGESMFLRVAACLPVGLLSDTDPWHWQYAWENYPFLQKVKQPTLSYEIGYLKPDQRCYLAAAQAVGQEPAHCLFIDDKPENADGARRAGMEAIHFQGHADLERQLRQLGVLND